MSSRPSLSVVINTRNAATTLKQCLESVVGWADDVLVVDQRSEDGSADVARRAGARVLLSEPTGYVEPARAAAVAAAAGDWVLVLDADEVMTGELRASIDRLLPVTSVDVFEIPRRNRVMGAEVTTGPFAPARDSQTRLFRRGSVTFSDIVHVPPSPTPGSTCERLPLSAGAILHLAYVDLQDFIERNLRYSVIEAERRHAAGEAISARRSTLEAVRRLAGGLFKHRGWRGGWRGLHLSVLWALAPLWVDACQRQLAEVGDRDAVRSVDAFAAREHRVGRAR